MIGRILFVSTLLALGGIVVDGAPVTDTLELPTLVAPTSADTCDGWPDPVGKIFDECPHGPTP